MPTGKERFFPGAYCKHPDTCREFGFCQIAQILNNAQPGELLALTDLTNCGHPDTNEGLARLDQYRGQITEQPIKTPTIQQ